MKHFSYLPYDGQDKFLFAQCFLDDEPIASEVAEDLVGRGIRVFFHSCGNKAALCAEQVAQAIANCDGAVFFISEKSVETLEFRNAINYALSISKPILCVKIGEFELGHGLNMQLANVEFVPYENKETTSEKILDTVATQDMIGEGMQVDTDRKKKRTLITIVAAALALFVLAAFFIIRGRVNYYRSAEYVLENANGSDYADISQLGEEAIEYLNGKSFGKINMANGGFTDLNAIKTLEVKEVDISGNPQVTSLMPLARCKGIQTVTISQDQLIFADELVNSGITVIIKE